VNALRLFALIALVAPAIARADGTTVSLEDLGYTASLRATSTQDTLTLAIPTRADRVLTGATLRLELAPAAESQVLGLEVLVNGERVQLVDEHTLQSGREVVVPIAGALVGTRSSLGLRVRAASTGPCAAPVAPGTWRFLAGGTLELASSPLRLPSDLAILPLPFFEAGPDAVATGQIPVVFLRPPTPAMVRVAGLVASWVGIRSGARARFAVATGLPADGHAIVLAEGLADAQALGLAAPAAGSLRMMDNPRAPGGLAKLLVIAGRNAGELESAALALVDGPTPKGEVVEVPLRAPAAPMPAYAAPRWQRVKDFLPLAELPGGDALEHRGTASRTMRLPFRLPPDLFFWLTDQPALELSYSQQGAPVHVSVELNGVYVGSLDPGRRGGWGRVRLPIHRRQLQGYNELLIHLDHGDESCGGVPGDARLVIDGGASGLRLRGHTHFARLPDLSLLAHDGFPFTRRPDLGETTAVVPEQPQPAEVASLLSFVATFAAATGQWSSGLVVATADEVLRAPGRPRDLLVFGTPADQPLLRAWARRLPLETTGSPRVAAHTGGLADLLSGRVFDGEPGRAGDVLDHLTRAVTVMAIESPLHAGRTAVFVTAPEPAAIPTVGVLQRPADSRFRDGDVLVASGEQLWMFRLGAPFDDGRLPPWHQFLWSLAGHWVALFPAAVCGLLLLAAVLKAALRARVSRRLFEMGDSAP
jgi:hypothetical protein